MKTSTSRSLPFVRIPTIAFAIAIAITLGSGTSDARGRGRGVGGAGAGVRPGYGVGGVGAGAARVATPRGVGRVGVGVGAPGRGALPRGYYHAVPGRYRTVRYAGYMCRYANGVYYRAMTYQGQTVWVVVR